MALTQQDLDQFVKAEALNAATMALHAETVRRYEIEARAARERLRSLDAANGVFAFVSPLLDGMLMAAGVGLLAVAIFG